MRSMDAQNPKDFLPRLGSIPQEPPQNLHNLLPYIDQHLEKR